MMESWFKTTSDGSTVFYPWGNLNKQGYVISSQHDFGRLRVQINIWIAVTMGLFSLSIQWSWLVGCGVVGVEVGFEYASGGDASESAVTGAFRTPFRSSPC